MQTKEVETLLTKSIYNILSLLKLDTVPIPSWKENFSKLPDDLKQLLFKTAMKRTIFTNKLFERVCQNHITYFDFSGSKLPLID